jgi:hypothetical protein
VAVYVHSVKHPQDAVALLVIFAQRRIVSGLTAGALK